MSGLDAPEIEGEICPAAAMKADYLSAFAS
jgi:hypothetical protein